MNIIVVANKWWEAAPLVAVLQHINPQQQPLSAAPRELRDACQLGPGGASVPAPRLIARCNGVNIEVWCIQDLMDAAENSSLTWEKARVLPRINRGESETSLVVAFGTAACPVRSGHNGNVVIGTSIFVHDPYEKPPNPQKHWTHAQLNEVVTSDFQRLFDQLPTQFASDAEKRFLLAPNAPATPPSIHLDSQLISVGVVNVIKSADYPWADKRALEKFKDITKSTSTESLETTHGVIRLVLGARFLYISGLANAVGEFEQQVSRSPYSQNFVAAHNAAVALAWLIPALAMSLQSQ
jgi:hypothetical protein